MSDYENDSWEVYLPDAHGNFNLNTTNRKKQMFNDDEVQFINETVTKDLKVVDQKIDQMVNDLARLGKQLSDLKVVQSRLQSIAQAIKDELEDDENCNQRCC